MTYGKGREGEKQMIRGLEVLKNDLYIFGYPANQETSTPWAVIGNLSNNQFSAAIWSLKH